MSKNQTDARMPEARLPDARLSGERIPSDVRMDEERRPLRNHTNLRRRQYGGIGADDYCQDDFLVPSLNTRKQHKNSIFLPGKPSYQSNESMMAPTAFKP